MALLHVAEALLASFDTVVVGGDVFVGDPSAIGTESHVAPSTYPVLCIYLDPITQNVCAYEFGQHTHTHIIPISVLNGPLQAIKTIRCVCDAHLVLLYICAHKQS